MAVTASPELTPQPPALEQSANPQPPKKRPTALIIAAVAGILVVIVAAAVTILYTSTPSGPDPKDPKSAIPACREQVKSKMKAPATTQFPGGEVIGKTDDGQPQIDGVVDSQNSFGALVRGSYTCVLFHDGNGNLKVANVSVSG